MQSTGLKNDGPRGFVPCEVCGRKVSRHSLMFHEPKCFLRWQAQHHQKPRKKQSSLSKGKNMKSANRKPKSEPSCLVPCFVCRRKVSRHSLIFHEPKCLLRWKENNDLLPEEERRNTPPKFSFALSPGFKLNPDKASINADLASCDFESLFTTFTLNDDECLERPRTQTLKCQTKDIIIPVILDVEDKFERAPVMNQEKSYNNIDSTNSTEISAEKKSKINKRRFFQKFREGKKLLNESKNENNLNSGDKGSADCTKDATFSESLENTSWSKESLEQRTTETKDDQSTPQMFQKQKLMCTGQLIHCNTCKEMISNTTFALHKRHCLERCDDGKNIHEVLLSPKKSKTGTPFFLKCPYCLHVLEAEKLLDHQEVCNVDSITLTQSTSQTKKRGPPTVMCIICGRQYGSRSIAIHEQQCLQMWMQRDESDPVLETRKGNKTMRLPILYKPDGSIDIDAMITVAWSDHVDELVPCKNCGRKYHSDGFPFHQSVCSGCIDN